MATTIGITHITHYKYDRAVSLSPQTLRLRPSPHNKVPIKSYSLQITPKDHFINWYQDIFGNHVANIVINDKITEFKIEVDVKADINIINPFDFFIDKKYENFPFVYDDVNRAELGNYLQINESGALLSAWIDENVKKPLAKNKGEIKTLDLLIDINRRLNKSLDYVIRLEQGVYPVEELFSLGKGSCRDMAWALCQIYRHLDIAARFVSGYLVQLKADIKPVDGPSGVPEDVVDLHAWCEVYLPGSGWIGLDATSGLLAGEGHIPLSCSPLPHQSAPLDGLLDMCEATLHHEMILTRVHEDVRVTKPFSEGQWREIDALGLQIDKQIKSQDIRLTFGGEPTFISEENRDAPEWNTAALGDEKWQKSVELAFRLKNKFAPKASIHFGQGKWYGGEPLPRWAIGIFYRKDGEPVWNNEQLIAHKNKSKNKLNIKDCENFISHLAKALQLDDKCILQAQNIGQKKVAGFVLPIIYSLKNKKFITNKWQFKNNKINLLVGDSAIGYRLPLNEIPFIEEGVKEIPPLRSNFEKLPPLPSYKYFYDKAKKNFGKKPNNDYLKKLKFGYVRTALCAEIEDNKLCVFLPPISYAEHYLELISAIEFAAEKLQMPILIRGYEPVKDSRTGNFHVTPDPGVIEVNVQPAKDWNELKYINETVYEECRQVKLTAEKFMLDGRRVGTGGGNHIIAGASFPEDSPWLRRPDLLKSMILFFQNHPGISYLFSSIFIGPTSQAPRIDEARNDCLYELEIALSQIKSGDKKTTTQPWLVDRLLRNIMVDVTGNTHRSEICIDKLYSPDGERGRLGLVEFRGFEMTPHPRMNLLQVLFLRALITMFWDRPYISKPVRFGTNLHDKFMLPYFVWADFKNVLKELNDYGFAFKPEWFLPQFNFRFPIYGSRKINDVEIELRMALEPWPVLGEEAVSGGTSRGVDSALERLQIKVKNLDENRYKILCNRVEVPLHKIETSDDKIAAVRFKAWNPAQTMQPNLPINSPLIFDVYDVTNKCSIGGLKYHVFHPGGRNYDTTPINVNEAEGRMISRFETIGHSARKFNSKTIEKSSDFPFTLDLRRVL
jgi:uncharacterized protein (DUF2126 family)